MWRTKPQAGFLRKGENMKQKDNFTVDAKMFEGRAKETAVSNWEGGMENLDHEDWEQIMGGAG